MEIPKDLIKSYIKKLNISNTKSIHLNAHVGKSATKLDITELEIVSVGFIEAFLDNLLRKDKSFSIIFKVGNNQSFEEYKKQNNDGSPEEQLRKKFDSICNKVIKRLETINDKCVDIYQETGINTFGFGMPMIGRNEGNGKYIYAPLFTRNLTLKKITKEVNTYEITKQEDLPGEVNRALLSYLENNDGISIEEPEIKDRITEDFAIEYIDKFISNFEDGEDTEDRFYDMEPQEEDNTAFKKKLTYNLKVYINGVFGIYALQKETIKNSTKELLDKYDEIFNNEDDDITLEYQHPFGAKESDPSQTKILQTICKNSSDMIIMGPPGTGKSHTITSILTNALQNNQRCLVICEKKTALEVLAQNLDGLELKDSYTLIEDSNKDRKTIVKNVREYADNNKLRTVNPLTYDLDLNELQSYINDINNLHRKLDEEVINGNSWSQIAGMLIRLEDKIKNKGLIRNIIDFLESYKSLNSSTSFDNLTKQIIEASNFYKKDVTKYCKILSAFVNNGEGSIGDKYDVFLKTKKKINKKYIDCKILLENIKHERTDLGEKIGNYKIQMDIKLSNTIKKLKTESEEFEKILSKEQKTEYTNIGKLINKIETIINEISGLKINAENFNENSIIKFEEYFSKLNNSIQELKEKTVVYDKQNEGLRNHLNQIKQEIKNGKRQYGSQFYFMGNKGLIGSISFSKKIRERNNQINNIFREFDNYFNNYGKLYKVIKLVGTMRVKKIFEISAIINKHEHNLKPLFQPLNEILSISPDINILKKTIMEYSSDFIEIFDELNYLSRALGYELKKGSFSEIEESLQLIENQILQCEMDFKLFSDTYEWANYCSTKSNKFLDLLEGFYPLPKNEWKIYFSFGFFTKLLENNYDRHFDGINEEKYKNLIEASNAFKTDQIRKIKYDIQNAKFKALNQFKTNHGNLENTYSLRGTKSSGKKTLKQIVNTDFDFFSTFFPIVLTNPSTCAQLFEMKKNLFDIIIFDEASQLRIEDVMQCLVRGKRRIVCGDDKQMPPSDFFMSDITIEGDNLVYEDQDNEEVAKSIKTLELSNCESLLEYAEIMNYHSEMLKIHYRSKHPYLIDFSNKAYYQGQLHPFPATHSYVPIKFIEVPDAIYSKGENIKEAEYVIEVLRECLEYYGINNFPSIGIATFNIKQRKIILDKIAKLQLGKDKFAQQLNNLNPENFFVKNLDAIQGDERDIIIVSTTFGYTENKKFVQNFGPINTEKGFRFLNVMITRAKKKLIVISSIPKSYYSNYEDEIKERGGAYGKAGFYAWLSYVKAISDKNNDAREHVLKVLESFNTPLEKGNNRELLTGFSDTPFEDTIIEVLKKEFPNSIIEKGKYEAGLQIDIAITSPEGMKTAIECDGNKMGETDVSYSRDIYRKKWIQNKCGYEFYRVWSFDWLKNRREQEEKIINHLKRNGYT